MEYIERKIEDDNLGDVSSELEVDPLQDKIDIIFLKHSLLNAQELNLAEACTSAEDYGAFIDILNVALEEEPAFFILNGELLQTVQDIVHRKRFDYNHLENYNEIINDIISKVNALKTVDPSIVYRQVQAYVNWNLSVRQLGQTISVGEFYTALNEDAVLLSGLINGNIDDIDPYYFFSSTNYFATIMPELYQKHPRMLEITLDKIDASIKKRGFWNWAERDFARETQNNLQKVKTKEE